MKERTSARARPTGQQVLDWIDAHADQVGALTQWQRNIVALWCDGWQYKPSVRWGMATARRAFATAYQALTGDAAELAPEHRGSGASMGRGIVWSGLVEQMERESRGGRVP